MLAQVKITILSLNVRGLRNQVKRGSTCIFRFLKDQNCHIYLHQNTFSEQKDVSSDWGGAIFFSHRSTHSKGVSILINPSSKLNVEVSGKDLDDRIVSINLIYNSGKISICTHVIFMLQMTLNNNRNSY